MRKFERDQLELVVKVIFRAAVDRVDSALPSDATDGSGEMADFLENEAERRAMIHGYIGSVAAALPVLYAHLTDDGMGIGDFPEFEDFEARVKDYVALKLDPATNNHVFSPDEPYIHDLARTFVDTSFKDYLA